MSTTPFAEFGKEKRYDLHPGLLNVHVPRMLEAHKQAARYLRDTDLLKAGLVAFEGLLGRETANEIAGEILGSTIKDGLKNATLLANRTGPAAKAKEPLWEVVKRFFNPEMAKRLEVMFKEQTYLQHLLNEPNDGDEQKVFHSDTFFPAVKFWYFPQAVTPDDGPFWYVPYSPVLTDKLIAWHEDRVADLKAGKAEEWRGPGHREGSFRISPEEIWSLGLQEIPVCVNADTLVVANVFGFHRRGEVKEPKHRVSIHGSIRFNPFR